ncbi:HAMP domain-containing protein [Sulfurimonas sp. SAG-AH-194-C21]|nr:ATP-binding protein [Sulfurimonas sp. SAG-AH-194-C21]MDF1882323.1 HAMP domain-containing protein [Sulfurimonas sp. SAG-AH-194-C21]
MNILLINDNPVVNKLVTLSAQKTSDNLEVVESLENLESTTYDLVVIDDTLYSDELHMELNAKVQYSQSLYICSRDAEAVSGFTKILKKPFLPTDLVELFSVFSKEADEIDLSVLDEDDVEISLDAPDIEELDDEISLDELDEIGELDELEELDGLDELEELKDEESSDSILDDDEAQKVIDLLEETDTDLDEVLELEEELDLELEAEEETEDEEELDLDILLKDLDEYLKEFQEFVNLNIEKNNSLQEMVEQGRYLENSAVSLKNDQKIELQKLEGLAISSSEDRQEKSEKADDANRIIKFMGEARQQEKNFLLRGDFRYADATEVLVDKLITQAGTTKNRFNDKENKQLAQQIITKAKEYLRELHIVMEGKKNKSLVHARMIKLGRKVENKTIRLREDQKEELLAIEKLGKSNLVMRLEKREKADSANRIIKLMSEARQQEKNFLLRKEAAYAEVTLSLVREAIKEATKLQKKFADKENKKLAQTIIDTANQYIKEFKEVVGITNDNLIAEDKMASLGRRVEDRATRLRGDQKEELIRLEKLSTGLSKQRLDKRIKVETANTIIRLMGEARQQEKNYLLRSESSYIDVTIDLVTRAVIDAKLLSERFEDIDNKKLIDTMVDAAKIYLKEFKDVVIIIDKQEAKQTAMINAARSIENLASEIHTKTQKKVNTSRVIAVNIILSTLIIALFLGVLVAILLTKSISNPIKELVVVIDRLAKEDNADVPLVNNKDEIGQIARAISNFKEIVLTRKEKTEAQLVQSEKMVALGDLVAGVAHEINTPIGIAVTGSTHLQTQIKNLEILFENGTLKKANFREFVQNAMPTATTIQTNLERASQLVKSFKQVAVDQSSEEKREVVLYEYMQDILYSLQPKLKLVKQEVHISGDEKIKVETVPGALSQIVSNLILNSLKHAYAQDEEGTIRLDITTEDKNALIIYSDDGKGMSEEIIQRIYEPFFTTKRGEGGSGLGLSIVYNLVTQTLNGTIECFSQVGKGTRFEIRFPLENIDKGDAK